MRRSESEQKHGDPMSILGQGLKVWHAQPMVALLGWVGGRICGVSAAIPFLGP